MRRRLTRTALLLLCGLGCATVAPAPAGDGAWQAQSTLEEARKLMGAGQYAEALPIAERALAAREAAVGSLHPSLAPYLEVLGTLQGHVGEYARAESLLKRALALTENALGPEHLEVATALQALAALYLEQESPTQAEPLLVRALAIRETVFGGHHPLVAQSLRNLASTYKALGRFERAEALYQRALAIQEALRDQDPVQLAATLNSLANLHTDQGLYSKAEPLYERTLALWEGALGPEHPYVAMVLSNLAVLYLEQGLHARAEPLNRRALAIQEKRLGPNHLDVAQSLITLANGDADQGLHAQAEPLYQRVLDIQREVLGPNHPDVAKTLANLALLYTEQGFHDRAEPLFQHALVILEEALGPNHPDIATSLGNLALLYMEQGQLARAEPLLLRALALQEEGLGREHPDVAASLNHLATLRLSQQRLAEALPLFERAFQLSEQRLRREALVFSEKRLVGLLRSLRADEERLYGVLKAYPEDGRVRRLALTTGLLRKGRSAEELAQSSRTLYRRLGAEDRDTFERLRALRARLARLSLAGPGDMEPAVYQQSLKELEEQGDELETELARRSAPLRVLNTLPSPAQVVDRVAGALPRDGALVDFIAYEDRPLPSGSVPTAPRPAGQSRYLALVLHADGSTRAVDLGPAAPIDRAALQLRDALARRLVTWRQPAEALYRLVFRPLLPLLGATRHVLLCPDGQLALVPFAALHDGRRALVDSFEFAYLTAGKDVLPHPEDIAPRHSVVVLADPAFDAPLAAASSVVPASAQERSGALEEDVFATLRGGGADTPWVPLPHTRQEAEAIHSLLPQARLLLGEEATKQALLGLEPPGVLHVATHGQFLDDRVAIAGSRAVNSYGAVADTGPKVSLPEPLLRSLLVMAGANGSAARREDALVTALELAGMDLWGTQLVVLSACDSGRGEVRPGQGVYGLRRALVVAGAETVVMSLWKVNDKATQQLMVDYYRHLFAGKGRTAALHEAMRALRKKKEHPYFWAPFLSVGQDGPLREMTSVAP